MKKNNERNNNLKELEVLFDKKLDWQFYVIMMLFLMMIGTNYFALKIFANNVNEAIKFVPIKGTETPMIRSA